MAKGINREPEGLHGNVIELPRREESIHAAPGTAVKVEGFVYCLEHGEAHVASYDPYEEGYASCYQHTYGPLALRGYDPHRPLYYRTRKGDLA